MKTPHFIFAIFVLAFASPLSAQTLEGFDINPGPAGSIGATEITAVNGKVVVPADDGTSGREIWVSDGTQAGTFLVKDIAVAGGSNPTSLQAIDGLVYFQANDGSTGTEPWVTNGTSAGTVMLADVSPGSSSSYPAGFTKYNGEVYFSTTVGFYKSDGTTAGTALVAPIFNAFGITEMNGLLYFNGLGFGLADTGFNELYASDGTAAGTGIVKDINPVGNASPQDLVAVGSQLFFSAEEPATGRELWVSDGTAAGTHLVKDIGPGAASFGSFTHFFTPFDGQLYFAADDGSGRRLWTSDGTSAGTAVIPGLDNVGWLVTTATHLYFAANDGLTGIELWRTDGSSIEQVLDIRPGFATSFPLYLASINDKVYFRANDGSGMEPWVSDGTAAGTKRIADLNPGAGASDPLGFTGSGDLVYFRANDGTTGNELWVLTPGDPSVNAGPEISLDAVSVGIDEGQAAINSGTMSDADGDALLVSASIGVAAAVGSTTWTWSYNATDGPSESTTVTITVDDQNGGTADVSFDLIVNNVAPTVASVSVPVDPADISQPVSVSADFSDPAGSQDSPYSCSIDYGDGNGTAAGAISGMTCSATDYSYTAPGIYTVTVYVTDKDGGVGSAEAGSYMVVYDPDGGFVTGGGWIDSPAEACPSICGGASGKANFGFVSKYKKGQSAPSGETEFSFKAGGLNFHSASYDWLVVAGPQAKFKGDGMINGQGDFGFMLSAVDGKLTGGGDADKFRIKIWTNDEAETVIYDNQLGDDDNAGASDEIDGGSIVIHNANGPQTGKRDDLASQSTVPETYALHANYPNPFNPSTTIAFDLPNAGRVTLRVFDLLGRVVATLVDREMQAGVHRVAFDASSIPSGTYLYSLQAGPFAEIRRMIALK